MGKFDIDDILADLGVGRDPEEAKALARRKRGAPEPEAPPKHTIDKAEQAFSSLPAVPSGQRSYNKSITVENDPAVPVKPAAAPRPAVGDALSNVYTPDADPNALGLSGGKELGE